MNNQAAQKNSHDHDFALIHEKGEKRTWYVLIITVLTMAVEIVAGVKFGSMALLADGWHMSTHAAAFSITLFAYAYARRHAKNRAFSFGTGKISVLGGFASAMALLVVAALMALESCIRFLSPRDIQYTEAMAVAGLGLFVNLVCAAMLHGHHSHTHHHGHSHEVSRHHDHNLRGAYIHVLADALTSILAIIALAFGKFMGWWFLDPLMGVVGAIVISRWAYGLIRETGRILLDKSIEPNLLRAITDSVEQPGDAIITDLHVWKVGPADCAVIISLTTDTQKSPEAYKSRVAHIHGLSHITIEVNDRE